MQLRQIKVRTRSNRHLPNRAGRVRDFPKTRPGPHQPRRLNVALNSVLILRAGRNTNDPVEILSFPFPSPWLGKRDSSIRFQTCLPICMSAPAGHQAILPGAANICRACISCNHNGGTRPASWVYGPSRFRRRALAMKMAAVISTAALRFRRSWDSPARIRGGAQGTSRGCPSAKTSPRN